MIRTENSDFIYNYQCDTIQGKIGGMRKSMNIVHIVFSFNTGGIENLLVDIINNWNKKDKLLLCIINDSRNDELLKSIQLDECKTVVCLDRPVGGSNLIYLQKLHGVLEEFRPDVIHCHSNSVFKFCIPLKVLHPKWKLVLTVHDTKIYSQLSRTDFLLNFIFLYRILAISESVKSDIINRGISKKRVRLVYNGVDSQKFKAAVCIGDKKTIICVARLNPAKKGQDVLIKAVKKVAEKRQDFECLVVGEAPLEMPQCQSEIENLVVDLGVDKYVKLLGNRNDVPKLLAQADLFVLPSRYEGFGISVIEAFFSKLPVITSDIEGPKEIIKNNQYGYLFESDNEKQLADLICKVLNQDNSELVEFSYQYAMKNFSIDSMVKRLVDVYQGKM